MEIARRSAIDFAVAGYAKVKGNPTAHELFEYEQKIIKLFDLHDHLVELMTAHNMFEHRDHRQSATREITSKFEELIGFINDDFYVLDRRHHSFNTVQVLVKLAFYSNSEASKAEIIDTMWDQIAFGHRETALVIDLMLSLIRKHQIKTDDSRVISGMEHLDHTFSYGNSTSVSSSVFAAA